jgi:hypothetical protein
MNTKKLKEAIEILKEDLDGALLATDIYPTGVGTPIVGYNSNPQASALFDRVTVYMKKALEGAKFPGLGKYYLLNLENNAFVVVLLFENYQWGMLVDARKVNMGLLLNIAIPNARRSFEEAVKS